MACLGLWSTEEHEKGQVWCGDGTVGSNSGTWQLLCCPGCSPGVSKGAGALAEAAVGLGVQCPGWNKSHKPCLIPSLVWAPQLHSSAALVPWAQNCLGRCAMPLLTARAGGVTSISSSLRGQEKGKQPTEPKNQELGFLHLFMISSWLGLTCWTSVIQITHQ